MVTITLSDDQAKRLAEFIGYELLNNHLDVLMEVARNDPEDSQYSLKEIERIDSDLRDIFVDQLGYVLAIRDGSWWVEKRK